jgi:hypothetical protein
VLNMYTAAHASVPVEVRQNPVALSNYIESVGDKSEQAKLYQGCCRYEPALVNGAVLSTFGTPGADEY